MLGDVLRDLETPEGRAKYHPFANALFKVVQASVFGTWGQIVKGLQESGYEATEGGPIPGFGQLPPMVVGLAEKAFPGVDVNEMIGALRWLSSMSGQKGIGDGGLTSPSFPQSGRAGHNNGGQV